MNLKKIKFEECLPLQNAQYFNLLLSMIKKAQTRIWVNLYYVNILPDKDINYLSRELFEIIQQKVIDGLNIKILLGTKDFESSLEISNRVVQKYLEQLGVPCKLYKGQKIFSHSKYILIDNDISIIGSHNWSNRSLTIGVDDSVYIGSKELSQYLSNDFFKNWK